MSGSGFTDPCVRTLLFLLLSFGTLTNGYSQETLPLEYFSHLPRVEDPVFSPNGKYLAARVPINGRASIVISKVLSADDTAREPPGIIPYDKNFYPDWYRWANDDRLIMSVRTSSEIYDRLFYYSRLISTNRQAQELLLLNMQTVNGSFYRQQANVINLLKNDNDHILAALDNQAFGWANPLVHKINVYTNEKELIDRNSEDVLEWIADDTGELRIGVRYKLDYGKRDAIVFYRETGISEWNVLQHVDFFDPARIIPVRFDEDDHNILLVTNLAQVAAYNEHDNKNLFTYDLTTREITGKYINKKKQALMELVNRFQPDTDFDVVSQSRDKNRTVIKIYTDTNPPQYFIHDRKLNRFDKIASEYPELDDIELSKLERVHYQTRDGLNIPAFVTFPRDQTRQNLPFIIYPHDGPHRQDTPGFDKTVQFFTNRGYGVFQPQYRGSTGISIEHKEAGYKQWGKAIQDDITDGVNWLIQQGYADRDRICIVGSGFGGYTASMGLATTPDLFRCGISIDGYQNLLIMFNSLEKFLFKNDKRALWNDRSEAKGTSPHYLSENIQAPLLLIAHERSVDVPVKHTTQMFRRMKRLDKDVTYIELEEEDTDEKNEQIRFEAMDNFLNVHLNDPPHR